MSYDKWIKVDALILPPLAIVEVGLPNWMPLFSREWQQDAVFATQVVLLIYAAVRTVAFVDAWLLNRKKGE